MRKLLLCFVCLAAMLAAGTSLKAQEMTMELYPGWTWISYPSTDTLDLATAFGSFTPAAGDYIKSQAGYAEYYAGYGWYGSLSAFWPCKGYMYKSNRTEPVVVTLNIPLPQQMVTTAEPTDITATSAMVGSTVTIGESDHIFARGVCWGTEPMPDVNGNRTTDATVTGSQTVTLNGLTPNTTYYVRAYVATDNGLAYGNQQSFTTESGGGDTTGEGSGTYDDPYNVAAGIDLQGQNVTGWVHGYIVGSVKSGLSLVTSNADINWNTPFDLPTNVVIADDVACREISQCIIVNLPAGKPLRTQVNLMNNPGNLGKHLAVLGTLRIYFGQAGLRDSNGMESDFVLEGGNGGFIIDATANPAEGGEVSGGGSYEMGTVCTLTATPNEGYTFNNWTKYGIEVSTEATYSFIVTEDAAYVANFNYNGGGGSGGNHTYVDLGLPSGLLWATCNVGADAPEDYGDYFAWGETQPKDTYNWGTYQHCMGGEYTLTKYCTYSAYCSYGYNGFTDNLTTLLPEDDVATANWGSGWRMPTQMEFQELLYNTTLTGTTQNGVNGLLFTATNGNSLFLPTAGYRWDDELVDAGASGGYWSSSLYTGGPDNAWGLYFGFVLEFVSEYDYRFIGYSVRPVREN